ncbi:hypothetical protein SAMN05192574_112104 [Mucilaginibacter gossypiicola]|uniref:Uncharacterized protein n=1 Tax=Mucilaginibacter gossypiicola TaxID=551995 RepID=A0A1H8SCY6_9SPHI|nr:hypothetical protein [Mucilaginibacter gossypiicola]SEO76522.1 hypothetical protein SAMN05192574_112104 [Mucilaginibacter gossypiicola]
MNWELFIGGAGSLAAAYLFYRLFVKDGKPYYEDIGRKVLKVSYIKSWGLVITAIIAGIILIFQSLSV